MLSNIHTCYPNFEKSRGGDEDRAPLQISPNIYADSKVYGANMGPTWGRQDPGGSHVGPMNLAIWVVLSQLPMGS